jgi:hypothetical protein
MLNDLGYLGSIGFYDDDTQEMEIEVESYDDGMRQINRIEEYFVIDGPIAICSEDGRSMWKCHCQRRHD